MHPPARSLDVDDDGVMHHAVHNGGGDDGISQVIAGFLEGDVGRDQRRALAVAAVDDYEEERGVPGVVLSSRSSPISSIRRMSGAVYCLSLPCRLPSARPERR
jgi:hypothetical protein